MRLHSPLTSIYFVEALHCITELQCVHVDGAKKHTCHVQSINKYQWLLVSYLWFYSDCICVSHFVFLWEGVFVFSTSLYMSVSLLSGLSLSFPLPSLTPHSMLSHVVSHSDNDIKWYQLMNNVLVQIKVLPIFLKF